MIHNKNDHFHRKTNGLGVLLSWHIYPCHILIHLMAPPIDLERPDGHTNLERPAPVVDPVSCVIAAGTTPQGFLWVIVIWIYANMCRCCCTCILYAYIFVHNYTNIYTNINVTCVHILVHSLELHHDCIYKSLIKSLVHLYYDSMVTFGCAPVCLVLGRPRKWQRNHQLWTDLLWNVAGRHLVSNNDGFGCALCIPKWSVCTGRSRVFRVHRWLILGDRNQ